MEEYQNETLSSCVRICRKIQACNQEQFKLWINKFCELTKEHKQFFDHLKSIFIQGICTKHANIPISMLDNLMNLAPMDAALSNLQDSLSIANLDDDDDDDEELTWLKMSSDIKVKTCNFLSKMDLDQTQLLCRDMMIHARNPNSLHSLDCQSNAFYNHERYSRIKKVKINKMYWTANPKWRNSVTSLTCSKPGVFQALPKFNNLSTCCLYGSTPVLWRNKITFATLTQLHLDDCPMYCENLQAITNCLKLTHLVLKSRERTHASDPMKGALYMKLRDPTTKKLNMLKYIKVSASISLHVLFFHWLLYHGECKDVVTIINQGCREMRMFNIKERNAGEAMRHVSMLRIVNNEKRYSDNFHRIYSNMTELMEINKIRIAEMLLEVLDYGLRMDTSSRVRIFGLVPYFDKGQLRVIKRVELYDFEVDPIQIEWLHFASTNELFQKLELVLSIRTERLIANILEIEDTDEQVKLLSQFCTGLAKWVKFVWSPIMGMEHKISNHDHVYKLNVVMRVHRSKILEHLDLALTRRRRTELLSTWRLSLFPLVGQYLRKLLTKPLQFSFLTLFTFSICPCLNVSRYQRHQKTFFDAVVTIDGRTE